MNLYQHDLSMLNYDLNFTDAIDESYSLHRSSAAFLSCPSLYRYDEEDHSRNDRCGFSGTADESRNRPSPPKHRHDGSSPLPLGMDWSSPPLRLEGRDSVWPHDPQIGWSYCVTVPSWLLVQKSRVLDPVAFYRVQVGIQSPEGVTTVRVVLRRFKDFLNLFAELKMSFPKKNMSQAPPKKVLRIKSQELLEQRRCSLEDWMQNLLSDIDISRSLQVAMFLELEAAVRSSFNEVDVQGSDVNSTSDVGAGHSSIASDYGDEAPREISESGNTNPGVGSFTDLSTVNDTSEQDLINSLETSAKIGLTKPLRLDGTEFVPESKDSKRPTHPRRLSMESVGSDLSSANLSGASGVPANASSSVDLDFQFPRGLTVALPLDERHRLNRVLDTFQQRLMTAKTDMEDLIARLNQEAAARQFLTTKVKDLEVELETTTQSCKENMQQTVLTEKERITQMQWDVEDLRRKCMELELKLKSEEEERMHTESTKKSILDENKMLVDELYVAREQFDDLQKRHEDYELKSKTDVKLLVKEVKSLRNSQSELKHELGRLMKEKLEVERVLQKEKQRSEVADEANTKLLHECRILIRRLGECSVNFLVEEEDKLIVDTSLPSDAIDLLTTSDNRIGLLLAEALEKALINLLLEQTQLLAQEIENACKVADESNTNGGESNKSDDELRKILTDTLVDNATLRMQVNSVILCALRTRAKAEGHSDEEDDDDEEEETSLRNTVLSKFFER